MLYKLTADEQLIVSTFKDTSDIIACGPWVKPRLAVVHRIVLRDRGTEFVVHALCMDGKSAYYHHGSYCPKGRGNEDAGLALFEAWAKFDLRVRESMRD